jgi:hypothetical protein
MPYVARCRGSRRWWRRKAVVFFHRYVPLKKLDPLTVRVLARPTNLSSRASYRHGGRGSLPTNHRETPPIKVLTGEMPVTRSPIKLRH